VRSSSRRRSPAILRVFLTGTSALAAVCFGSAFTFAPAAHQAAVSPSRPAAANRALADSRAAAPAAGNKVTVQAGETLSGIAAGICGTPSDWTGFFAANRSILNSPDLIEPAQQLQISCTDPGYTPPAPKTTETAGSGSYGHPYYCGDGDGDGYDVSCPQAPAGVPEAHASQRNSTPVAVAAVSYHGNSSMQECIIRAESGGNPNIWNASGHWGLYQFSKGTWIAHGGNPADFGSASVAEQNQIYANTVAADGYSDWAPYDGC
jgi:LysM repeat protein